ncbi:MAG: long-chain fatty acid--CoA ligase [Gemmatimonadota bacterium]|jgi:long-chain acyl-CoA synthetase
MPTRTDGRQYVANPATLPEGTLAGLLFEAVETWDKADVLRRKVDGEWRTVSHAEILQVVRRVSLGLQALGLKRGDRVAILSENRPEWAEADFAALCTGIEDVPVYATLPPNQVKYILEDSGARLVFVSSAEQLAKIQAVWGGLPELERVLVFDDVVEDDDRVMTFRELVALGAREEDAGKGGDFKERALAVEPDDVATILYTSGTTGPPKGVMLTHQNIYANTQAVKPLLPMLPEDVGLSFLPLSHILQRMVDYRQFHAGMTICYADIADVATALGEVQPTIVVSTPRLYEKVYNAVMSATGVRGKLVRWAKAVGQRNADARLAGRAPSLGTRLQFAVADRLVFRKLRARVGGRLKFFVSGGAPLAEHIAHFFYGAGIMLLEGYGLTETSPVTNVNTLDDFRFGTVGKAVPGTEIMIADDGEILVRGPQVMKGYFNLPDATREAIDADGWFRTGDIGEIDADGYLRITDRKKDLIVTAGGKNIAPQPIENYVKRSPLVEEAVMLGDRRPYPIMLVVPNFESLRDWASGRGINEPDDATLLEDERVKDHMEEAVFGLVTDFARFERPKKIGFLPTEFTVEGGELTPTMKVKRRVVESRYADVIQALYGEEDDVQVGDED